MFKSKLIKNLYKEIEKLKEENKVLYDKKYELQKKLLDQKEIFEKKSRKKILKEYDVAVGGNGTLELLLALDRRNYGFVLKKIQPPVHTLPHSPAVSERCRPIMSVNRHCLKQDNKKWCETAELSAISHLFLSRATIQLSCIYFSSAKRT